MSRSSRVESMVQIMGLGHHVSTTNQQHPTKEQNKSYKIPISKTPIINKKKRAIVKFPKMKLNALSFKFDNKKFLMFVSSKIVQGKKNPCGDRTMWR